MTDPARGGSSAGDWPERNTGQRTNYDLISYIKYANGSPADEAKKHFELRLVEAELRRRAIPLGRSLDIGCATGRYPFWFHSFGFKAHGVDVEPTAIEICRELARGASNVSFEVRNILEEGLPDDYDVITTMMGTFNHIPRGQQDAFLHRIVACLRPGGLFFLSSWNPESPHLGFLSFYGRRDRDQLRSNCRPAPEMVSCMRDAGWADCVAVPFSFLPDDCYNTWPLQPAQLEVFDSQLRDVLSISDSQMYLIVAGTCG
jgi:SAM-dependent methyltransferase